MVCTTVVICPVLFHVATHIFMNHEDDYKRCFEGNRAIFTSSKCKI